MSGARYQIGGRESVGQATLRRSSRGSYHSCWQSSQQQLRVHQWWRPKWRRLKHALHAWHREMRRRHGQSSRSKRPNINRERCSLPLLIFPHCGSETSIIELSLCRLVGLESEEHSYMAQIMLVCETRHVLSRNHQSMPHIYIRSDQSRRTQKCVFSFSGLAMHSQFAGDGVTFPSQGIRTNHISPQIVYR